MTDHTRDVLVIAAVMLWNAFVIVGITYLVGWQNWSPWWYLTLFILAQRYSSRTDT